MEGGREEEYRHYKLYTVLYRDSYGGRGEPGISH